MFVSILCCLFLMLFALLGNYNNIISESCPSLLAPSPCHPFSSSAERFPIRGRVFVSASWQLPRGSIEVLVAVVVVALLLLLLLII